MGRKIIWSKNPEITRMKLREKMKGNKYALGHKQTKEHINNSSFRRMKKEIINLQLYKDEVIIGLMLSDASLSKPQTQFQNARFFLTQSQKYRELIDFVENYLNDLGFSTSRQSYVRELGDIINLSTRHYPDFRILREKWYTEGKKIIPTDIILTPKTLAWWFMGDGGSRYTYKKLIVEVQLCTESFQIREVRFLIKSLESLGVKSRIKRYGVGNRIFIKKKDSVIRFMTIIKPFILPCFYYKVKIPELDSRKICKQAL